MLRCYEPAHIVGISKIAYVLATPRCLEWRRDLPRTSTNNDPPDSDSQDPCRRPAGRHRGDRRGPRQPVAGVLVLDGHITHRRPSQRAPWSSQSTVALGAPGAPGERGALGEADGAVPDGTTVFDNEIPGVANLDPALLGALRQAATGAAGDGVEFFVDSGWRSPEYQERLLREAVLKYGSEEEAARWVATPSTSAHVSGDAVDVGPSDATAWLSEHGAEYGLCQIYGNEPWHYELRPEAIATAAPHVRRPNARSKDAAVMRALRQGTGVNPISTHQGATMSRTLRPLAAFAIVGLISAGCSNGSAENGNSGTASSSGTASNKRVTGQGKIASPSSAGSSPSTAGLPRLPPARSRSSSRPRTTARRGRNGPRTPGSAGDELLKW